MKEENGESVPPPIEFTIFYEEIARLTFLFDVRRSESNHSTLYSNVLLKAWSEFVSMIPINVEICLYLFGAKNTFRTFLAPTVLRYREDKEKVQKWGKINVRAFNDVSDEDSKASGTSCISCILTSPKLLKEAFKKGGTLILIKSDEKSDIEEDKLEPILKLLQENRLRVHVIHGVAALSDFRKDPNTFNVVKAARLSNGKIYDVPEVKDQRVAVVKAARKLQNIFRDIVQLGVPNWANLQVTEIFLNKEQSSNSLKFFVDKGLAANREYSVVVSLFTFNFGGDFKMTSEAFNSKDIRSYVVHDFKETKFASGVDLPGKVVNFSVSLNIDPLYYNVTTVVFSVNAVRELVRPSSYFDPVVLDCWTNYDTTFENYKHAAIDLANPSMPGLIVYISLIAVVRPLTMANVYIVVADQMYKEKKTYQVYDDGLGDPDITRNDGIYSAYLDAANFDRGGGYHTLYIHVNASDDMPLLRPLPLYPSVNQSSIRSTCCGRRYYSVHSKPLVSKNFVRSLTYAGVLFVKPFEENDRYAAAHPNRILDLRIFRADDVTGQVGLQWTSVGKTYVYDYDPEVFESSKLAYEVKYVQGNPEHMMSWDADKMHRVVDTWDTTSQHSKGLLKPNSSGRGHTEQHTLFVKKLRQVMEPVRPQDEFLFFAVRAVRTDSNGKVVKGKPSNVVTFSLKKIEGLPTGEERSTSLSPSASTETNSTDKTPASTHKTPAPTHKTPASTHKTSTSTSEISNSTPETFVSPIKTTSTSDYEDYTVDPDTPKEEEEELSAAETKVTEILTITQFVTTPNVTFEQNGDAIQAVRIHETETKSGDIGIALEYLITIGALWAGVILVLMVVCVRFYCYNTEKRVQPSPKLVSVPGSTPQSKPPSPVSQDMSRNIQAIPGKPPVPLQNIPGKPQMQVQSIPGKPQMQVQNIPGTPPMQVQNVPGSQLVKSSLTSNAEPMTKSTLTSNAESMTKSTLTSNAESMTKSTLTSNAESMTKSTLTSNAESMTKSTLTSNTEPMTKSTLTSRTEATRSLSPSSRETIKSSRSSSEASPKSPYSSSPEDVEDDALEESRMPKDS